MAIRGDTLKIQIQVEAQTREINKMQSKLTGLTNQLTGLASKSRGMSQAWKTGFAVTAVNQMTNALGRLSRQFANVVKEGIEFNKELEAARLSIGSMFQAADEKQFTNLNSALEATDDLLSKIKQRAIDTSADFRLLAQGFQQNFQRMLAAGITDVNDMLDLVSMVNTFAQRTARPGQQDIQFQQELAAVLEGRKSVSNALVRQLESEGINVKKAIAQGDLLQKFRESKAGKSTQIFEAEFFKTPAGQIASFKDVLAIKKGEAAIPLYEKLGDSAKKWADIISDPKIVQSFQNISREIAGVWSAGEKWLIQVIKTPGAIDNIATAVKTLGIVMAALFTGQAISWITKFGLAVAGSQAMVIAFSGVVAAFTFDAFVKEIQLGDKTLTQWVDVGMQHVNNNLEDLALSFKSFASSIKVSITSLALSMQNSVIGSLKSIADAVINTDSLFRKTLSAWPAEIAKTSKGIGKSTFDLFTTKAGDEFVGDIQDTLIAPFEYASNLFENALALFDPFNDEDLRQAQQEDIEYQKSIATQKQQLRDDEYLSLKIAAGEKADLYDSASQAERDFMDLDQDYSAESFQQMDDYLTEIIKKKEKASTIFPRGIFPTIAEASRGGGKKTLRPKTLKEQKTFIDGIEVRKAQEVTPFDRLKSQKMFPTDEMDKMDEFSAKLDKIGIKSKGIQDSFVAISTTIVDSMSEGITNVIMGTQTWGEALRDIGENVLTTILDQLIKSSIIGLFQFIPGLNLVGQAASGLGFSEGGLVPYAPSKGGGDNMVAGLQSGEYVMPTRTVSQFGAGFFDVLKNTGRVPGAAVGGSSNQASPNVNVNVAMVNTRREMNKYIDSSDGQKQYYDVTRKRLYS